MPVLKLEASPKKVPVYAAQFNPQQKQLLATGEQAGNVKIWVLSRDLTDEAAKERDILEEMAQVTLEWHTSSAWTSATWFI